MRITLLLLILSFFSCQQGVENKKNEKQKPVEKKEPAHFQNFEERMKHEVMEKLAITSTEKFDMKIYYAQLNNDDKQDAVITVNRLEYAINEASKTENPAKRAEIGYMGSFNHFFYYDGAKDALSFPKVIPSSAKAPLQVYFEHIQSDSYKDIIIQYRIRNAAFRSYYILHDLSLQLVFQWKDFDQVGERNYEANYFAYEEGTFCLVKDILIYKGKIKNYTTTIPDIYAYNPSILSTKKLEYRFMFDPKKLKYVTNAKPNDEL